jgi:cation diffusion facilitator family transporter
VAASGGKKAIIAALLANAGIAVAKFVGFLLTQASSMLAESIHSVADSGNQALLLLGGNRARREPDANHPFGYGRARYFWSFVVAVVLFALGSLFSLYEGVEKLRHPHELTSPIIAVGILVVAIGLETASFRTAIHEARPLKGTRTWWAFVRETKVPELPVVLLEDLGALVGLVIALIGVGLAVVTGDPVWDALGTLAIGTLLGIISVILAIEMKSLLMGEGADPVHAAAMRDALERTDGIEEILDLRSQHIGPEELLVAGQVRMASGLDLDGVIRSIDTAESRMREAVPYTARIFLEPDHADVTPLSVSDRRGHRENGSSPGGHGG